MCRWEEARACALLFFFLGSVLWMPFVGIALAALSTVWGWTPLLTAAAALTAVSLLLPRGVRNLSLMHSPSATLLLKYFSFKVVWAHKLDHSHQFVFAAHPHG